MIDHTHNPDALSWVASASEAGTDFPIQNLPFGVFVPSRKRRAAARRRRDRRPDSRVACLRGRRPDHGRRRPAARDSAAASLNALMARGRADWIALRHALFGLLDADAPDADGSRTRCARRS